MPGLFLLDLHAAIGYIICIINIYINGVNQNSLHI